MSQDPPFSDNLGMESGNNSGGNVSGMPPKKAHMLDMASQARLMAQERDSSDKPASELLRERAGIPAPLRGGAVNGESVQIGEGVSMV
jgi:hypothetical protein